MSSGTWETTRSSTYQGQAIVAAIMSFTESLFGGLYAGLLALVPPDSVIEHVLWDYELRGGVSQQLLGTGV
jgi:hypothetical protein